MMLPLRTSIGLAMTFLGALQLAAAGTRDNVTSGVAVVGDYTGSLRPQIHYSPPKNFMNDPNGMFRDANGTWHLYYQYNPTALVAGNQHWGHATSRDLYHWTNQPIALSGPSEDVAVFSGSAVVDTNNTSGFFPNQKNGVVAIYTLSKTNADGTNGLQTQGISFSHDGGYHFTPYKHNPVLDVNSTQFRDPKVMWHDGRWVMMVAYAMEFVIGIYTSPNLIDWTHASNFSGHGLLGFQWECPNLVRIPHYDQEGQKVGSMWLLMLSVNPHAPVGGSLAEYYPGTFNGTHFVPIDSIARLNDFGKDNYAAQFFNGQSDDEDPVLISWASNWQYTQDVPTDRENWRSAMTVPRRSYLTKIERIGWKLGSAPYDLSPVMGKVLASDASLQNKTRVVDFAEVESNAVYWEANVTGIPDVVTHISKMATLNVTLWSPVSGEYVRAGYYFGGDQPFFMDRGGVRGFDNVFFTDKFSTNTLAHKGKWSMSGIMDRSLLEIFINGGVHSGTVSFFPTQPLTLMTIGSANMPKGAEISVRVHALNSAWKAMESQDGLVYGNQSVTRSHKMNG